MSDYANLKALAETATSGPWQTEQAYPIVQPAYPALGSICSALIWQDAHFIAAANPSAVLALIAENERVISRLCVCRDCGGQGEIYSGRHADQGYYQPPEPVMHVCGTCDGDGVLGPLEDFEALAAERDQLRAEVAGLKTGYEAYERVNAELKAENEALRKSLAGLLDVQGIAGRAVMGKGEQS